MDFSYPKKVEELRARLLGFMDEVVYPNEKTYHDQVEAAADRWQNPPIMEEMKAKGRQAGLWNLFLPESEYGAGLTNLEYAPLCEIMGALGPSPPRSSTARRPTPATWRCSTSTAPTNRRRRGSSPCSPAKSARPSP